MLRVATLLVPLAAVLLGTKFHKLLRLKGGLPPASISLFCGDLLFLVGYGALWTLALHLSPRRPVKVLFYLNTLFLLLLLVVEHAYFLITGSLLSSYLVLYSLRHFFEVKDIVKSELSAVHYVGLLAAAALGTAPLVLWRRLPEGARPRPERRWAAGALLLGALALGLRGLPVPAALEPLRPDPFLAFAREVLELRRATRAGPLSFPQTIQPAEPMTIEADPQAPRYNVVIIVLESARARSVTPYNPALSTTPVLDRLARGGVRASTAYTVIPHTSKALVAIECGIYPKVTMPIDEAAVDALPSDCLATLLRRQGYATAFFSPAIEGFEQTDQLVRNFGFAEFFGAHALPSQGFDVTASYFGYEDDILLAPSLRWVDEHKGQPFFLTYLTLAAHHNYRVPRGFPQERYSSDEVLNRYLNTLRYTDRFVGKIVDGFAARHLLDRTLFVLIGDHGEGFFEHGRNFHDNTIYDEGLQVPLVLYGAGVQRPGRVLDGLRQNIDLLPTILGVLGLRLKSGSVPGKDLFNTDGHERLYFSCWYHAECMALRQGARKLVYHYRSRPLQLFDLAADPGERQDLALSPAPPREEMARMQQELLTWKEQVNARYEAQADNRRPRFVTRTPEPVASPMDVRLGPYLRLRGCDVGRTVLEVGEAAELTYHFEVLRRPEPGWGLFFHVLGPRGTFLNAGHDVVEGSYPIERWQEGEFIQDHHRIYLPGWLPAGRYEVVLGLWNHNIRGRPNRAVPAGSGASIDGDNRVHVATLHVMPDTRK